MKEWSSDHPARRGHIKRTSPVQRKKRATVQSLLYGAKKVRRHPQNHKSVRVRSGICGSHRNGKWHEMMRSPKYCSRTLQTDFAIRERTPPNDVLRTFCISNSGVT
ncbi:hypothetical protein TNIN_105021 [Trichonephila inaurata madagascariensis]|uniref:Uncharacterized protein n=1 Tax=Trichonephila inaurata madagascariensis TaxID=2747483 RepID=A0A8X6XJR6_9ARAC|nr:hypothetical protein TNIN_105021 [Trichonephila inaurata madagascariensis]